MTDIDLTPMNDLVARELFAFEAAEKLIKKAHVPEEHQTQVRIAAQVETRRVWDDTPVTDGTKFYYLEMALAATLVTWKPVARQAWDACVNELAQDEDRDDKSVDRLRAANPYQDPQ